MKGYLEINRFRNINLNDSFFNSLKSDYKEFESWFNKKADADAILSYENGQIQGFLYMKVEEGPISEVIPFL